ncbi:MULTISPECIES: amidohydrolase [unclassified Rhodococcus (in: high G+C Gram-positive bacteria)]|uniref:amidohydrolase n=1 Tax=unclassified Rhodococcus (in: high G+C Gram-positive bacteria) TaxID=192944 RepID=UPI00077B1C12|nr:MULTISPECIES: amidohydrolase [unclassified Rhodococcus (in: high G+C Gram-positive bacteria)]KXX61951.1 amidohydrolase [Rhodococcus sp. LB1]PBC56514.1 amidohydrolase [Rhodococcus sp. ACPA1]RZK72386.1 MAG: amidohydrolase [Rhodococcus sp. (in: high G+C Gram-positive bacteria)]
MNTPARPRIVRGRRILTSAAESANAIAMIGDRIVALGDSDDLHRQFPTAWVDDRGDAVISPGFHDAHLHLAMAAENELKLDVSPAHASTLTQLLDKVGAAAKDDPAQGWVRAVGYDDAKMPEGRVLTRWDLDTVTGNVPTIVLHVACHWGVVNSAALAAGGITDNSEPPSGGDFGRDGTGRLNGILYERALTDFAYAQGDVDGRTVVPELGLDERIAALGTVIRRWHAAGLTSVCDAFAGPADVRLFEAAREQGLLTMRVGFLLAAEHYDSVHRLGLRSGFGDDYLRFVGVKALVDGAVGGRTLLLEEPDHDTGHHGIQVLTREELAEVVQKVHGDGNRVCVHANGDRAIRLVLDEFETAQKKMPRPGLRHRIEHCSVVDEDILRRMNELSAIAVPFGNYVHQHGSHLIDWYGEDRVERMFAHRAFLDAGVAVAGSSDFPCGAVEPLLAMQSMVTRTGWDGALVGSSQRVSPTEALAIYTAGSAVATGEEDRKGTLAAGRLADFVVLDEDPLDVPHDQISKIGVRSTFVGGVEVYARD